MLQNKSLRLAEVDLMSDLVRAKRRVRCVRGFDWDAVTGASEPRGAEGHEGENLIDNGFVDDAQDFRKLDRVRLWIVQLVEKHASEETPLRIVLLLSQASHVKIVAIHGSFRCKRSRTLALEGVSSSPSGGPRH